jgi:hypothetical protein
MAKKIMFSDKYCLTQAVLNGTKTMTRRKFTLTLDKNVDGKLIRVYPSKVFFDNGKWLFDYEGVIYNLPKENYPRYKVGDIVAIAQSYKEVYPNADFEMVGNGFMTESAGWNNKMFVRASLMKRHIRITDVKVEHLQDISDKECLREGVKRASIGFYAEGVKVKDCEKEAHRETASGCLKLFPFPRLAFASLIDKISGNGTWERNPWVVAYSFELVD